MNVLEQIRQVKRLMHKAEWEPAFRKLSSLERQLSGREVTVKAKRKDPVRIEESEQ